MKFRDPFKSKTEQDTINYLNGKMVGGFISPSISETLCLLSVSKGTPIQTTLQKILHGYLKNIDRDALLEEIAKQIIREWKEHVTDTQILFQETPTTEEFQKYKEYIQEKLLKRKIPQITMTEIMKKVDDGI